MALKPRHLKRYKDLFVLFLKHRKELANEVMNQAPEFLDEAIEREVKEGKPEELADDLEAMGPTFIKLGQLLSTRSDLLPQPYLTALSRLQDDVTPFPYEQVEEIVEQELGIPANDAFASFQPEPLAAASLGQVHRAKLANGRDVIVKVRRPGVGQTIRDDLDALEDLVEFIDRRTEVGRRYAFRHLFDEFRTNLVAELDYRQEARNLETMQRILRTYPRVFVPKHVPECTTRRLLTMDFIDGRSVGGIEGLARTEIDGRGLAEELAEAYLDQILVTGFFHADPHPGNLLLTPEGKLALLDLGMVARIEPDLRYKLVRLLLAIGDGRGSEVARILGDLGTKLEDFDESNYTRTVSNLVVRYRDVVVSEANPGRMLMEIAQAAAKGGLRPPPSLVMLGRTLAHLADVTRTLDPNFSPNELMRQRAQTIMRRHMMQRLSPGEMFDALLETGDFVQKLPLRLNRILDTVSNNDVRMNLRFVDEENWDRTLQRSANRITLGVVIAALIVGAGLFSRGESAFQVMGYAGIPMLMLLGAGVLSVLLVLQIFLGRSRRQ